MINCPKCKSENMIGAIFCRNCGEKLNLDELDPADIAGGFSKELEKEKKGSMTGRIITIIFLVLFFGGFGLAAIPSAGTTDGELENLDARREALRFNSRLSKLKRQSKGYKYSSLQVTEIINSALGLSEAMKIEGALTPEEGKMILESVNVQLMDENRAKVVGKFSVMGKAPLYMTIYVRADSVDDSFALIPYKAKIGKLPMAPSVVQKQLLSRIEEYGAFTQIYGKIKSGTIADNEFKFTLKQ